MLNSTVRALVLSIAATTCGCSGCRRSEAGVAPAELPALSGASPTVALAVPGFADAVNAVPVGVTRPVPVVVAVIGIGDTPEEQCAVWREIVADRAFVLCPRGRPYFVQPDAGAEPGEAGVGIAQDDPADEAPDEGGAPATPAASTPPAPPKQMGFYFPDVPALDGELAAGLSALKSRWGPYIGEGAPIYAGFSRGAFLGAQIVAKHPDRFDRVILIEGGHTPWTDDQAAAFARGGGKKRVLFVCGQTSCMDEAQVAAATLARHEVETRAVLGAGEGHGYKHQVKEELRRSFDWLTDGDPRWRVR